MFGKTVKAAIGIDGSKNPAIALLDVAIMGDESNLDRTQF